MQVSDWWMLLSFYQNVLAVPLAVVVFVLLLRARAPRRRALYAALLVLVFLPHIQLYVGNYYFDHLCRTQAGEFIYRTVDNVEGILQMRPRDGSKDYFDRMRAGDVPEDPWGHTNLEAQWPWSLIGPYRFFEVPAGREPIPSLPWRSVLHASMFEKADAGHKVARYFGYDGKKLETFRKEASATSRSLYGFTWLERKNPLLWFLNIHQGEIWVKDLETEDTLAVKRGFLRTRPLGICPPNKHDYMTVEFLQKVLRPSAPSPET